MTHKLGRWRGNQNRLQRRSVHDHVRVAHHAAHIERIRPLVDCARNAGGLP